MDIPFDVSYHFNSNLYDVPNKPLQVQKAVEWLQSQLTNNANDTHKKIEILGLIGVYSRMLRDFSTARHALSSAIELSESIGSLPHKTVNLIRLAHVYQWQKQFSLSETLFEEVFAYCSNYSELEPYIDFAYQHFGKCKFDQAQYKEAQYCFEKALEIRKSKGDHFLIESTQLALDEALRRIRV
ncbi:MAG: tetratricopeptide repeat protein [Scytonema sp. PMC 1069.18]|nr:tetratricopeptide repeat protein [Scytonema sp. PMC 1069.18]MEC4881490.1 tetratricopeptide repeat protein [Scytonema sp. PMC 1070.18]